MMTYQQLRNRLKVHAEMIRFLLLFLKYGKVTVARLAITDSTLHGDVDWSFALDCYRNRV